MDWAYGPVRCHHRARYSIQLDAMICGICAEQFGSDEKWSASLTRDAVQVLAITGLLDGQAGSPYQRSRQSPL